MRLSLLFLCEKESSAAVRQSSIVDTSYVVVVSSLCLKINGIALPAVLFPFFGGKSRNAGGWQTILHKKMSVRCIGSATMYPDFL